MKDCKPCDPGPNTLFGNGRFSDTSHTFSVKDKPMVLRACGLGPDACISIMQRFESCGESTACDAVDLNGCPITLSSDSPIAVIHVTGDYFAVLDGAEPEDVTLTLSQLPSSVTYTVNGGGSMGCGSNTSFVCLSDGVVLVNEKTGATCEIRVPEVPAFIDCAGAPIANGASLVKCSDLVGLICEQIGDLPIDSARIGG